MNIFADFEARIAAGFASAIAAGASARRARPRPLRRRAAARCRATAISRPMPRWSTPRRPRPPARTRARSPRRWSPSLRRGPGRRRGRGRRARASSTSGCKPAVFEAVLRDGARAGRRLRTRRRRAAAGRSTSNTSAPIRPGRCTSATRAAPCSATRSPTCWPSPGHEVDARILHQRRRRAGRRARPLGLPALPRGARRGDRRDPRGALSRRLSEGRSARRSRAESARALARQPEAEWLPLVRDARHRRDDGDDPRRSRRARHRARGVLLRALADRRAGDRVAEAIAALRAKGLIYEGRLPPPKGAPVEDWEDREQTLFRSTEFGDDVDRPLLKSDGAYTYFASDIAYHKDKIDRGFASLIDVWGADHGGYVKRMRAAVAALSDGKRRARGPAVPARAADARRRAGEDVEALRRFRHACARWSTRSASIAVRFMMLMRKNDATLDFDLAKVIEQSEGQSGLLRAIRPCARLQRRAAGRAPPSPTSTSRRPRWRAPTSACSATKASGR